MTTQNPRFSRTIPVPAVEGQEGNWKASYSGTIVGVRLRLTEEALGVRMKLDKKPTRVDERYRENMKRKEKWNEWDFILIRKRNKKNKQDNTKTTKKLNKMLRCLFTVILFFICRPKFSDTGVHWIYLIAEIYILNCGSLEIFWMRHERSSSSILRKTISEPKTVIEPSTFWWPVRRSNHWATKSQMESQGASSTYMCHLSRSHSVEGTIRYLNSDFIRFHRWDIYFELWKVTLSTYSGFRLGRTYVELAP